MKLDRSLAGALPLLMWLLCVAAVTLFPFDFQAQPAGAQQAVRALSSFPSYRPTASDVVLNVLLFVPLGLWLGSRRQRWSGSTLILVAAAAGFLVSLTVESLQVLLPRRGTSFFDLAANTAGAVLGTAGARAAGSSVAAGVAWLRGRPRVLVGLGGGLTLLAVLVSAALQQQTRLINWDSEYPLAIGNEPTGDRPWRGRVFELELTDAATSPAVVRRFAAGAPVTLPGARIAAFDFSGAAPYRDSAGNLPDLGWTKGPSTDGRAGAALEGRPWLQTEGPASPIVHRLRESNAFTVRILCSTGDWNQRGPARIVSNSFDPGLRNFTLGQEGADLVFRFRTPHSGLNGYRPQVVVPGVFSDDSPREILVTYDGTTLLVAVARSDRVHRTELTPGSSLAVAVTSLHLEAGELQILKIVYLAVISLLAGAPIVLLGQTNRLPLLLSIAWAAVFALLFESVLVMTAGRWYDWNNVATTASVGMLVLTLLSITLPKPGFAMRPPPLASLAARRACS